MRNQRLFGWLATLALLFSLSMAACIQPIPAPGSKAGAIVVAQAAAGDATEVNKAAMRGWFDAFNAHDLDGLDRAVDKYYAPDYVLHDPTVPNFTGGAATVKKLVRETLQTLPDLHITVNSMTAQGDMVAIRSTVTGTQPDGKPLRFWGLNILRFVNGQMAEEWELAEATGAEVVGSEIGKQK